MDVPSGFQAEKKQENYASLDNLTHKLEGERDEPEDGTHDNDI